MKSASLFVFGALASLSLMCGSFAHADSIGVADCYDKQGQVSVSLEVFPDDIRPLSKIPLVGQIIQNEAGGTAATGKEVYNNHEGIKLTKKTKAVRVYEGVGFKLTVPTAPASLAHLEATAEDGSKIDAQIQCEIYQPGDLK